MHPQLAPQDAYRAQLEKAGLVISGHNPELGLVEMIELPDHPYFVGTQAHPEFKSKPFAPHPLFSGFIGAARAHRDAQPGKAPVAPAKAAAAPLTSVKAL